MELKRFALPGIIGGIIALLFLMTLTPYVTGAGYDLLRGILGGTATTPYRQRLLWPALSAGGTLETYRAVLVAFHIVAFPALLALLSLWFRRVLGENRAITSLIVTALLIPAMFQSWGGLNSWSLIEAALVVLALLNSRKLLTVTGIVILATVNRPATAAFIPLMVYTLERDKRHALLWFVTWSGVYGLITLLTGPAPHMFGENWVLNTFNANTQTWKAGAALRNGAIFAVITGLAVVGYKGAPKSLQSLAPVLPLYLLTIAIAAQWYETRLWLTVFPALIPLAVLGLSGLLELVRNE